MLGRLLHILRKSGIVLPSDLAILIKTMTECEATTNELDRPLRWAGHQRHQGRPGPIWGSGRVRWRHAPGGLVHAGHRHPRPPGSRRATPRGGPNPPGDHASGRVVLGQAGGAVYGPDSPHLDRRMPSLPAWKA